MDKIAVLIPCYNESKTVEKVVTDFRRVLPDATVYVYDNNSTDGTAELAARAGAVVRHEYQQGKDVYKRQVRHRADLNALPRRRAFHNDRRDSGQPTVFRLGGRFWHRRRRLRSAGGPRRDEKDLEMCIRDRL